MNCYRKNLLIVFSILSILLNGKNTRLIGMKDYLSRKDKAGLQNAFLILRKS